MNDDDAATVGEACLPQVIIEGCQASVHGLSTAELERGLGVAMARLRSLRSSLLHVRGPSRRVLDDAGAALTRLLEGAGTLVVLGSGAASLVAQALAQTAGWSIPGEAGIERKSRPRLRFHDNLDPRTLTRAIQHLDLDYARFLLLSPADDHTAAAQSTAVVAALRSRGVSPETRVLFAGALSPTAAVAMSGAAISVLADASGTDRGWPLPIGALLPAIAIGIDADAVLAGGRAMVAACGSTEVPPVLEAAVRMALAAKGVGLEIVMPLHDRLERTGDLLVRGRRGTTAIAALGPVDRHDRLGSMPPKTLLTLVSSAAAGGRTDLDLAHSAAVDRVRRRAFAAGMPVLELRLPRIEAATVGALIAHARIADALVGGDGGRPW